MVLFPVMMILRNDPNLFWVKALVAALLMTGFYFIFRFGLRRFRFKKSDLKAAGLTISSSASGWRRAGEKIKPKSENFIFSLEMRFEPKREIMKKPKSEKSETSIKKPSAPPQSNKRKRTRTDENVKELFGVHIISETDIENHFGTSEEKPDGESKN